MAWTALDRLCDEFEASIPSPAGGSAAAAAAAIAASLLVMVCRGSPSWEQAGELAAAATSLRDRLAVLGEEDVAALGALVAAARARPAADAGLERARTEASRVPREIAVLAAEVAALAVVAGAQCASPLRAEAAAAARLAEVAEGIASSIVARNAGAAA